MRLNAKPGARGQPICTAHGRISVGRTSKSLRRKSLGGSGASCWRMSGLCSATRTYASSLTPKSCIVRCGTGACVCAHTGGTRAHYFGVRDSGYQLKRFRREGHIDGRLLHEVTNLVHGQLLHGIQQPSLLHKWHLRGDKVGGGWTHVTTPCQTHTETSRPHLSVIKQRSQCPQRTSDLASEWVPLDLVRKVVFQPCVLCVCVCGVVCVGVGGGVERGVWGWCAQTSQLTYITP